MRFVFVVLAALGTLALLGGLDLVGFTDAREARDARVSRELIANREWLTPLYGTDALLEKPVLAYVPEVLAALVSRGDAMRDSPVRSRQIRALVALALIAVTAAIASKHFGRRAAAWSALVLISTLGLPFAVRTDGTQLWAALLGWIGCGALASTVVGPERPGTARLFGGYLALAAALVVAGPMPALWPLGALVLYASLARDRRLLSRARPLAGLALMIGIATPWYGAMLNLHGPRFLAHAAWFPYAADAPRAWYLGPLLALSFLVISCHPWSSLVPEAMLHAATWWRFAPRRATAHLAADPPPPVESDESAVERERREESAAHFFIAALVASLIPIALHSGAPLSAALLALPAAAMLCGRLIDHVFEDPARLARPVSRAARMMALVGTAATVLIFVASRRIPEAAAELRLLAAVTFPTSWLPLLATWRSSPRVAVAFMALPIGLGMPVATLFVLPQMEGYLNARAVAITMNQQSPPLAPLALIEPPPPSLRFYARRNLVVTEPRASALQDLRGSDGLAWIAFPPSREPEAARKLGVPLEIVMRSPSLVLARVNPETPLNGALSAR